MQLAHLREFQQSDTSAVNALGVAAFEQFSDHYQDWPVFQQKIAGMAALAETGEIIVAATGSKIVGAVAYLGPQAPKSEFFPPAWAVMRMLVVAPEYRGQGLGSTLAQACFAKALRDGAEVFGLHTSRIMSVALPMYLRMGFKFVREAPPIHGVEYGIYAKNIT
jgi:GNAT superfamily N-acetyltransferase